MYRLPVSIETENFFDAEMSQLGWPSNLLTPGIDFYGDKLSSFLVRLRRLALQRYSGIKLRSNIIAFFIYIFLEDPSIIFARILVNVTGISNKFPIKL